jgi:hypothetical protein
MELNKDMISLKNISSSSNTELLDYRSEYNSLKSKVLETIQTMKQLLNQLSSTDITNNKLQVFIFYNDIYYIYRKMFLLYLKQLIKQNYQIKKTTLKV